MGARSGRIATALLLVVCLHCVASRGETAHASLDEGQVSVYDSAANVTYASGTSYDVVVRSDNPTIQLVSIPVGFRPSDLAISGEWVAALNRHAATIALVRTSSRSVDGLVELDVGVMRLFAAGDRRFGAINPFDQSMTLIDAESGAILDRVEFPAAVPIAGAAIGARIAVLVAAPDAIVILDGTTLDVYVTIPLSHRYRDLEQRQGTEMSAVSSDRVALIDMQTSALAGEFELTGSDIPSEVVRNGDTTGPRLNAAEGAVERDISPIDVRRAARPVSPTAVAKEIAALPPPLPEVTSGLPRQTAPVAVLTEADTDDDGASGSSADAQAAPGPAATPEETEVPEIYRRRPPLVRLGGPSTRAPHFEASEANFMEEFERALKIGKDSESLLNADWNADIEDIHSEGGLSYVDGRLTVEKPVTFRVDDMTIRADRLEYLEADRQLTLEGAVRLEREGSVFTADSLVVSDPIPEWEGMPLPLVPTEGGKAAVRPLVPAGSDPEGFKPSVTHGLLQAENVVWQEEGLRELKADSLALDLRDGSGMAVNARGHAGPLYYGSDELVIEGPGNFTADKLWVTTCELPVPHYRIQLSRAELRQNRRIIGSNARLQIGKVTTPFYYPRYSTVLSGEQYIQGTELRIGGEPSLGFTIEAAQWFKAAEHANIAPRLYLTTDEGIGLGLDGEYDLMNAPAATFFRSQGEFQTLYTTEERGYVEWYHRQELTRNTVALVQLEKWSDADFVKDFYSNEYDDRSGPRSFVNLTRTRPEYIATATVSPSLHSFTSETEKLPELTFHLLERRAAGGLYGTFDGALGYYDREQDGEDSMRTVTVGRLSYDMNVAPGFNVLPFVEADGAFYADTPGGGSEVVRGSMAAGVTLQGRLQRTFPGMRQFSGFKHLILPSTTLMYRPAATVDADDTPRFDDLDDAPARFRIESTIDNIVLGRNASTEEVWPVLRVTLYQGNDLYNERVESSDYELEIEVRPRPWWGLQTIGEIHEVEVGDGDPGEDYSRVLAYLFYDNELGRNNLNGRIGFAYTEAAGDVLNQEVLYGGGYRINDNWSLAFEQRFDIDRNELTRQSYAIRRRLHKWEMQFTIRNRDRGVDFGLEFNLTDFHNFGLGL